MTAVAWQSNTQINVHAVLNLSCSSADDALASLLILSSDLNFLSFLMHDAELNLLLIPLSFDNPVNITGRQMNIVRVKCTRRHNLFNLNDTSPTSPSNVGIEIPGCFLKNNVSVCVSLPALNNRKVTNKGLFQDVVSSVEFRRLPWRRCNDCWLAIGAKLDWEPTVLNDSVGSSGRIKSCNASTACSASLR